MTQTNTFAERLRFVMDEMNISGSDLAKIVGINRSNVTHYLKGDYEPKRDVIHRMASVLRVTEDWLMGYDAPMFAKDKESQSEDLVNGDPELTEILTRARDDPHIRMLFSVTKDAKPEDIEMAIQIIQRFKGE